MDPRTTFFGASFAVVPAALSSLLLTATATGQTPSFSSSSYPVGLGPVGLAIADLNGDGRLDLVTGNYEAGNVSVLLGTSGGGFGMATNFPVGGQPGAVAIGDLNGDGRPDLVVANYGLAILFGDGQGGFGAPITLTIGATTDNVAIGDVNGDGKPDIVANSASSYFAFVLLGDGQGGFGSATAYFVGGSPQTVGIADVNGDGNLDIVTPVWNDSVLAVLFGDGLGGFGGPTYFPVGSGPISSTIGDVNGDGKLDVVVANYQSSTVSVLLGDGHGGFAATANYAVGSHPLGVALGDINGDGRPDILAASNTMNEVSILLGNGQGVFVASSSISVGSQPRNPVTADLNGDGRLDFVTVDRQSNAVSVRLNTASQPPVANAGLDQSIHAGQTVHLDGSSSFDDNTPSASLVYAWTLVSVPGGSSAVLAGANTSAATFVADRPGTYVAQLVVTDDGGLSSSPDTVTVASTNLAPTANAGSDQGAVVSNIVMLNGTGSSDPEMDPLTYAWIMTVRPVGSTAFLVGDQTANPTFVPNVTGLYTIGLTVTDGFQSSAVDEVSVIVITRQQFAVNTTMNVMNTVSALPSTSVTTAGNQKALSQWLGQAIQQINSGNLANARMKLDLAIARTDGCALRGVPDGQGPDRDWVTDCTAQFSLYSALVAARSALGL